MYVKVSGWSVPTALANRNRERKISPKFLTDRSSFMDVRAGCLFRNVCFFPGFGGPDRSFWPDVRSGQKLPLWAEFSFLTKESFCGSHS